jgi:hypothetical protein
MRTGLLIIGTLAFMIASGALAAVGTLRVLMSLGMKYNNNYEFYGQHPAVALIPIIGIVGFVIPGIVVWRLRENHWRVSLCTLVMAMTLIAVLFGAIAVLMRIAAT